MFGMIWGSLVEKRQFMGKKMIKPIKTSFWDQNMNQLLINNEKLWKIVNVYREEFFLLWEEDRRSMRSIRAMIIESRVLECQKSTFWSLFDRRNKNQRLWSNYWMEEFLSIFTVLKNGGGGGLFIATRMSWRA